MSSHDEESLGTPGNLPIESAAAGVERPQHAGQGGPLPGEPAGDGDVDAAAPPGGGRRKRLKRWHVLGGIAVVVAVAVLVLSLITVPYYALTPGQAQSVAPLISVSPPSAVHFHTGSVLLVDVQETQLRAIDWLYFKLDNNATIIKASNILGPETPAQYNTEGVIDMSNAQQAATVVALNELGYHVKVVPVGALLYALLPGSPAEAHLAVGDKITAVGSRAVTSAQGLTEALGLAKPGTTVELTVSTFSPAVVKRVKVTLGTWRIVGRNNSAAPACLPDGQGNRYPVAVRSPNGGLGFPGKGQAAQPLGCLGVLQVESAYRIGKLPVRIDLRSEGIVGPSAGLSFTLGLMQKLDSENLTGGHKVAATGTMSINGAVGAIGGVEQKTIAVRSSGATLFLVPAANYSRAKAYAGPHLRVVAVSSISQAISVLERYGGKLKKVA